MLEEDKTSSISQPSILVIRSRKTIQSELEAEGDPVGEPEAEDDPVDEPGFYNHWRRTKPGFYISCRTTSIEKDLFPSERGAGRKCVLNPDRVGISRRRRRSQRCRMDEASTSRLWM